MQLLLDKGADPNVKTGASRPVSVFAARCGNKEALELLDQRRATIEDASQSHTDDQGCTTIHHAIRGGDTVILGYLLASHPVPTHEDKFGRNMLDYASMSKSSEMIEKVLKLHKSNNLELESSSAWSPLHWTCQDGSYDLLKILIEAGIKSQAVKTEMPAACWSPFDLAVYWQNTRLSSVDDETRNSNPWIQALVVQDDVDGTDSISLDALRYDSLLSPNNRYGGECDGYYSVRDHIEIKFPASCIRT